MDCGPEQVRPNQYQTILCNDTKTTISADTNHLIHQRHEKKYDLSAKFAISKVDFIIDTAATICSVKRLDLFDKYYETNKIVLWGYAKQLQVAYAGDIILRTNTNYLYKLTNVLYIPELGINILSTHALQKSLSLFDGDKATIFDNDKNVILIGYKADNLYKTSLNIIHPISSKHEMIQSIRSLTKSQSRSYIIKLWHDRLGHIGLIPLRKILDDHKINITTKDLESYLTTKCEVCIRSKYDRSINKVSSTDIVYDIGERVHSDIGGPINPKTYDGYAYYITFLDKTSRYLHISLMQSKDQAYDRFKLYISLIKNQLNKQVKEIFTDNGTEYINDRFHIFVGEYGIIHRKAPIYTKEPNGMIERINLTLMNKVRCLLSQSGLHDNMWGEALLAATYLYNITPHSSLGFKTPYELYHKRLPKINAIKTWGSIAYYHTNKKLRKLSPRKSKAVLIGYSEHKHYKLYDIQLRKPVWSRDPTILEGKFLNTTKMAMNKPIDMNIPKHMNHKDTIYKHKLRDYKQAAIDASPTHKVEVQIPLPSINMTNINDNIYTIDDTMLADFVKTITNNQPTDYILSSTTMKEPSTYNQAMKSDEADK
jgi:hypothetical protein